MKSLPRSTVLWLIAYVATMGAGLGLLWSARAGAVAQLDDPQQRAQWQEWKQQEESRTLEKTSPVERRPPTSEEPPTLVLMRDHFAAAVATWLAMGTVLFAFLAFVVHGIIAGRASPPPAKPAEEADQDALLFARRAGK